MTLEEFDAKFEWKPPTQEKFADMERIAREWIECGNRAPEGICGSRDVLWLIDEIHRLQRANATAAQSEMKALDSLENARDELRRKEGELFALRKVPGDWAEEMRADNERLGNLVARLNSSLQWAVDNSHKAQGERGQALPMMRAALAAVAEHWKAKKP